MRINPLTIPRLVKVITVILCGIIFYCSNGEEFMSIKSLWCDACADFTRNRLSGKIIGVSQAAVSIGLVAAGVGEAIGQNWFTAAACAVIAIANAAYARESLKRRAARASAPLCTPA
jgi:hypothetical protein